MNSWNQTLTSKFVCRWTNFAELVHRWTWVLSKEMHECITHSPIHSFIHSPIPSFIHSPIHSFTHSLIHSFTHSLIHSLTNSLIHSLTNSLIHSLTNSSIHSLTNSLIHSRIHSFTLWLAIIALKRLCHEIKTNFDEILFVVWDIKGHPPGYRGTLGRGSQLHPKCLKPSWEEKRSSENLLLIISANLIFLMALIFFNNLFWEQLFHLTPHKLKDHFIFRILKNKSWKPTRVQKNLGGSLANSVGHIYDITRAKVSKVRSTNLFEGFFQMGSSGCLGPSGRPGLLKDLRNNW